MRFLRVTDVNNHETLIPENGIILIQDFQILLINGNVLKVKETINEIKVQNYV